MTVPANPFVTPAPQEALPMTLLQFVLTVSGYLRTEHGVTLTDIAAYCSAFDVDFPAFVGYWQSEGASARRTADEIALDMQHFVNGVSADVKARLIGA